MTVSSKRALKLLLAVAMVAGALISAGGPQLASADTTCDDSRSCFWEDASFLDCKIVRDAQDPTFADNDPCNFGGDGFNDDISSAKNKESFTITLCGDIDYNGGVSQKLTAGQVEAQVNNNDTASSLKYANVSC
ncbi:MAG TPA: peptidase inhibitor family I36 protein [Actinomycetota bacterium]|nr:peptidase inhibitor family I36 protein [Actinomycetota bacterium]